MFELFFKTTLSLVSDFKTMNLQRPTKPPFTNLAHMVNQHPFKSLSLQISLPSPTCELQAFTHHFAFHDDWVGHLLLEEPSCLTQTEKSSSQEMLTLVRRQLRGAIFFLVLSLQSWKHSPSELSQKPQKAC